MRLVLFLGALLLCAQTSLADRLEISDQSHKERMERSVQVEMTEFMFSVKIDLALQEQYGPYEVKNIYAGSNEEVKAIAEDATTLIPHELWSSEVVESAVGENEVIIVVSVPSSIVSKDMTVVVEANHEDASMQDGCSDTFAFSGPGWWEELKRLISVVLNCLPTETQTVRLCNNTNRGYQNPTGNPSEGRNDRIKRQLRALGVSLGDCRDNGCAAHDGTCQVDAVNYEDVPGSDQPSNDPDCGGTKEVKVTGLCGCDAFSQ